MAFFFFLEVLMIHHCQIIKCKFLNITSGFLYLGANNLHKSCFSILVKALSLKENKSLKLAQFVTTTESSTHMQGQETKYSPALCGLELINQEAGLSPHLLSSHSTASCA